MDVRVLIEEKGEWILVYLPSRLGTIVRSELTTNSIGIWPGSEINREEEEHNELIFMGLDQREYHVLKLEQNIYFYDYRYI